MSEIIIPSSSSTDAAVLPVFSVAKSSAPLKGIMLSKRPAVAVAGASQPGASQRRDVFRKCVQRQEVVHPCGRNLAAVPAELPLELRYPGSGKPPPQFDAQATLASLVRRRLQLRREAAEAAALARAKRERRAAMALVMRYLIQGGAGGEGGMSWEEGARTASLIVSATEHFPDASELARRKAAAAEAELAQRKAAAAETEAEAAHSRPAWARSSTEEETREEAECAEMLDFAASLNADDFLQNLEVRSCPVWALALHPHPALLSHAPYPTQTHASGQCPCGPHSRGTQGSGQRNGSLLGEGGASTC
jgi:hypothetical protein